MTQAPLRLSRGKLLLPGECPGGLGLQIDWTHPMARGLLACFVPVPNGLVDLVKPRAAFGAVTADRRGLCAEGVAFAAGSTPDIDLTSGAFTIVVVGAMLATTAFTYLYNRSAYVNESNNQGITLQWDGSALRSVMSNNNSVTFYAHNVTSFTPTVGQPICVGLGSDGATSRTLWINGALNGTKTSTTNFNPAAVASGQLTVGTSAAWRAHITCVWARELREEEHQQINYDPYCFLTADNPGLVYAPPILDPGGRMFAMFPP